MTDDESRLRVPPHSLEAEQAVLGALMLENAAWDRGVGDTLVAKHFYRHEHRLIYIAIGQLIIACKAADVITVHAQLSGVPSGDTIDLSYLNALCASIPSAANARYYAGIVLESARRRQLITALDGAVSRVWQTDQPIDEQLNVIANGIARLEAQTQELVPERIDALVVERLDHITEMAEGKDVQSWSTGLPQLDRLLKGGFHPGRIYLVGGRPGMGKSAFALWTTLNRTLIENSVALYLSQEMPKTEVTERAITIAGKVSYNAVQTGKLNDREWGRMSEGIEKLSRADFHIDEQVGISHGDIRVKARYVKGLQLLVVDYVQLCSGVGESEGRGRDQTRTEELSIISRSLKQLAKQLHCAVLVLSGLGRAVDERAYRRPIMSDLRDCGQLEADADVIILLFQLRALDSTGRRILGFDIPKNRQGSPGLVAVDFWGEMMEFAESEYAAEDLLKPEKKSQGGAL